MPKFRAVLGKIFSFLGGMSLTLVVLLTIWIVQVCRETGLDASIIPMLRAAYYLNEFYVDPMDPTATTKRILSGMINGLDPHTVFMPPEAVKSFQEDMRGGYGGIGIGAKPTTDEKYLRVKDVLESGPAEKAGIKPGDLIVSIDGQAVAKHTLRENFERIRGPIDTLVDLGVSNRSDGPSKSVKVKREAIEPPTAQWSWIESNGKKIFAARITQFNEEAFPQIIQAILAARKEYEGEVSGIILDLRDNPGGLVNSAVGISAIFGKQGDLVVSSKGRHMDHEWRARPDDWSLGGKEDDKLVETLKIANPWLDSAPMAVLVNRRSASASEILAGALKDWKRAIIVGNITFGKGSIQTVLKIGPNIGSMKVTNARYYTPNGHPIQAVGVPVDIEVPSKLDRGPREADLPTHLAGQEKVEVKGMQAKNPDFDAKDPETENELKIESERSTFSKKLTISDEDRYVKAAKEALTKSNEKIAKTP